MPLPVEKSESIIVNTSTQINSITYWLDTEELDVYFKNGSYRYNKVPRHVWDRLREAPSKGKFVNAEIKNKYTFTKLS